MADKTQKYSKIREISESKVENLDKITTKRISKETILQTDKNLNVIRLVFMVTIKRLKIKVKGSSNS